jgi:metal-responsive CopG/Arc/MetJ family transcriptional regulator
MKKDKETRITIRFPSTLVEELRQVAQRDARSLNSEVVYAVQQVVAQARKEKKRAQSLDVPNLHQ